MMIELLASIAIGVTAMALYPFEREPIFKDVVNKREAGPEIHYKRAAKEKIDENNK